jgi:hypothetical protein
MQFIFSVTVIHGRDNEKRHCNRYFIYTVAYMLLYGRTVTLYRGRVPCITDLEKISKKYRKKNEKICVLFGTVQDARKVLKFHCNPSVVTIKKI